MKRIFVASIAALFTLSTLSETTISTTTHKEKLTGKAKWSKWVHDYDASRRSNDGWLSLVGLYWLSEGDNSIGSAKGNLHRLPNDMPATFGSINVDHEQLKFTRLDNNIRIDDKDVSSGLLQVDKTIVSLGSYSFYIIKREKGYAIRLKNSKSPYLAHFKGTHFFPYAHDWAIPAKLIKNKTPKKLAIATVYGTLRENESAGILEFQYHGKTLHLEAVSYGKEEPMALMFADESSEDKTYGAGRFLDVEWPTDGDMTVINFNYAYNPPCAITSFATCPLPPRQNKLDVSVEAGELFSSH